MARQILVVEDEEILCKNLIHSLRRHGFAVQGAGCCAEAWAVLETCPIEVILLDLGLPDGDGLDMLAQVRDQYPHILVMIITSWEGREIEERAYQLGARAFLNKPLSLRHVRDILHTFDTLLDGGDNACG